MPRHVRSGGARLGAHRLAVFVLVALCAVLLAPVGVGATPNAQSGVNIRILPINRARLVAGQRFDFRVEVSGALAEKSDAGAYTVLINGQPAAEFFGTAPTKSNANINSAELTWRGVSLNRAGKYEVYVEAGPAKKSVVYEALQAKPNGKPAKNVILFVGDGMSWQMLTIARTVSKGLTEGKFNGLLEMDRMEETGYVTTSGYDSLVTDSANSASAYATGQKGVVNAMGTYEDNTKDVFDDPRVENIIELAKRSRGMATGLVTTAEIEDATPAAMFAHTRRRAEKQYIADQLLDDPLHQPDVIFGGGSAYFIPKSTAGSKRTDERNLLGDFRNAGYSVVGNATELNAAGNNNRILGLFHPADMNVFIDRAYTRDPQTLGPYTDQPTLFNMTQKALDVLANSESGKKNGFFLMVEGASIDKQLHPIDWERATGDVIEMDKAVGIAKAFAAKKEDTLIVVVADHGHSVSMYGTYDTTKGPGNPEAVGVYNEAKFPTFTDSDGDGFPDTWSPSRTLAIGFGNHPEYRDDFIFNPRPISPTIQDPNAPKGTTKYIANPTRDPKGILYPSNLPSIEGVEVHSADDVPLLASGPNARAFHGIHDNTDLFFGIVSALGIDATKTAGKTSNEPVSMALGAVLALSVVVGAGTYLRRPGLDTGNPFGYVVRKSERFVAALQAAGRSFRAAMNERER